MFASFDWSNQKLKILILPNKPIIIQFLQRLSFDLKYCVSIFLDQDQKWNSMCQQSINNNSVAPVVPIMGVKLDRLHVFDDFRTLKMGKKSLYEFSIQFCNILHSPLNKSFLQNRCSVPPKVSRTIFDQL